MPAGRLLRAVVFAGATAALSGGSSSRWLWWLVDAATAAGCRPVFMYPRTRKLLTINVVALLFTVALLTLVLTRSAGADTGAPQSTLAPAALADITSPPSAAITAAVAATMPASNPLPHGCATLFTQRQFAAAARPLYRGDRLPTARAQRRLAGLARCQHSPRATRNVLKLQRHLAAVQRANRCSDSNVPACIHEASSRWHVSYSQMLGRARCESSLNHLASNGTHFGLYQFLPSTWSGETSYGSHSYWSAKWNALGAAEMQARGMGD